MLTDSMIAVRLREASDEFRVLEETHHRLDLELIQLQKRLLGVCSKIIFIY